MITALIRKKSWAVAFCGFVTLSQFSAPIKGADTRRTSVDNTDLVTPLAQQATDQGLAYLATRQHEDGSFGSGSLYRRNVGITALCGMAFLAGGHTPNRGLYGETVEKTIQFILSASQPSGFINQVNSSSHGPMYGHGFATLFLAEVYGMTSRKEVRERLEKAVQVINNSQNREGGWRYYPESRDADVSVTVCQIMALRAARNCGIYVPKNTVDRCIEYVEKCQNPDGGFRYMLTRQRGSAFARSAAGLVALYSAGIYEGRSIQRGLDYLMRYLPRGELMRYESHYFYGHYYAVQAMWQAGEHYWRSWYPAVRDELLARRLPNGSWSYATYTSEYATAMSCIVLQVPNSYIPIFQR